MKRDSFSPGQAQQIKGLEMDVEHARVERKAYRDALQAISDQAIGDLEPHLYAYAVLNPE